MAVMQMKLYLLLPLENARKFYLLLGGSGKNQVNFSLFYLCAMKVSEVAHKLPWESSDKTTQLNKEGKRLGFLVSVSGKS